MKFLTITLLLFVASLCTMTAVACIIEFSNNIGIIRAYGLAVLNLFPALLTIVHAISISGD